MVRLLVILIGIASCKAELDISLVAHSCICCNKSKSLAGLLTSYRLDLSYRGDWPSRIMEYFGSDGSEPEL